MRNLKVMMSYRGTAYHGFQIQENSLTVQEVVEKCVGKVLNEPVSIQGCSRTDTGVHARQFCFSVQTNSRIHELGFVRGVNGELPADISILSCEEVDPDFHARFSCKGKEYVYLMHNSECKDPFTKDLAYHYRRKFNLQLVQETAKCFIGTKDFRAFCTDNGRNNINTIRTVRHFEIRKQDEKIYFQIQGDGFLYHMVRIIVGTLIDVNEGKILPEQLDQIFASGNRLLAGRTAPAQGLYLNQVFYS
ncbi:MAG: tRNA pseudouridine(38-40) synthase TruA [Oscillospiraceae bacterium]|nr:tRNA pseudouridine(38-40) synthase TruA [Oscillospiraceae bacterium]